MVIFKFEVKKLVSSISLWSLLMIFFIFNLFLIRSTLWDAYPDFVAETAKTTGILLNDSYGVRLEKMSVQSDNIWLYGQLKEDTTEVTDHFDDYDITEVGATYIDYLNKVNSNELPLTLSNIIRDKYKDMQEVVKQKALSDEALSLQHASATPFMHENLFEIIIGWLMIEGMIISVLIALLSVGFEKQNETEGFVYTTRTGRSVVMKKLCATLVVALGTFLLLTLGTLLVYFTVHDYSVLEQSSISNVFNYRNDLIAGYRPFVTWQSHTISTYLLSKIGITLGLLVTFILSAFILDIIIRNSYISFFAILILNGLIIVLPMVLSGNNLNFYLTLSPVWLWLKHSLWFTDGDVDILWKNFEMLGITMSLGILISGYVTAFYRFKRRDLL